MFDFETFLTFASAFAVFAASPGPDNITIFSKTISSGPLHGFAYGVGVVLSIYCFVLLSTIGFSAIGSFLSSNLAFLQYFGATYLVYIGITTWRAAPIPNPNVAVGNVQRMFVTGFILNISNPKMPFFYLALLPGIFGVRVFSVSEIIAILAIITLIEAFVVGGHILLAWKARKAFKEPKLVRLLNKVAGGLMIGVGVFIVTRQYN